jgi:hypothetical protein
MLKNRQSPKQAFCGRFKLLKIIFSQLLRGFLIFFIFLLYKKVFEELGFRQRCFCLVGHTGTHLISKVKQRWTRIVLGWVTTQMTSMLSAVRRWTVVAWEVVVEDPERSYSTCLREISKNASRGPLFLLKG